MSLMMNGPYTVVARVYQSGVRGGPASVEVGRVDAILDGAEPQSVAVAIDPGVIQGALAELQARPAATPPNARRGGRRR